MIDSDNILVERDWLRRMVKPFEDPDVISSEALRWDYRREDHFINRYQALTGINDPMSLFIGNYDRYSILTGKWTGFPVIEEQRDGWTRVVLDPTHVPTMGANGYIVRRSAFTIVPISDYLFDIDFVFDLAARGQCTVARVDVPIRHYFCDSVRKFYLEDAAANGRLLLLRSGGPTVVSVDREPATRRPALCRLDADNSSAADPSCARILAATRPGLAFSPPRVLDHPHGVRGRNYSRTHPSDHPRPLGLEPVAAC